MKPFGLQFAVTSQVALGFLAGAGLTHAALVPAPAVVAAAAEAKPATPEPIVPDLGQEPRPYTLQNVQEALGALDAQIDKALKDLDAAVDKEMGK